MKKISILGATGSIGQNTLDLISNEKDNFKVVGLTGSGNIDLLARMLSILVLILLQRLMKVSFLI